MSEYRRKWPGLKLEAYPVQSSMTGAPLMVHLKGRTDQIRPLLAKVRAKWIGIQRAWVMSTYAADELFKELDTLENSKTASRVAARYKLARTVKDYLQEFKRVSPTIEKDIRDGNIDAAKEKFVALGEALSPLATMLDSVRFERKDEQRKMQNVLQWLRRLKSSFSGKYLQGDQLDIETWITMQIPEVEATLKSLVRVQDRLDTYTTVEKTFQHGSFKIINRFGYRSDEYVAALQVFDKAADKLRPKGFGNLLYGDVHLVGGSEAKGWAGMYRAATDTILLNVEAAHRFDDVFTLVHEFGHRHWFKKLSEGQREAYEDHYSGKAGIDLAARQDMWQALVKGEFSPQKAISYLRDPSLEGAFLSWFKYTYSGTGMRTKDMLNAHQRGEAWPETNFVRPKSRYVFPADETETVTVSQYARTNVKEDYAETFAHYVLGMKVPPEAMERFRSASGV
jgi:hypothetical protein